MKMKMKAAICGVLAAAMMAVAGCGGGNTAKPASSAQAGQSQLMQTIKNRGELIVGTASGYPPYEFVDTSKSDKTIVGIDMELAQKVADKLGGETQGGGHELFFPALLAGHRKSRHCHRGDQSHG